MRGEPGRRLDMRAQGEGGRAAAYNGGSEKPARANKGGHLRNSWERQGRREAMGKEREEK